MRRTVLTIALAWIALVCGCSSSDSSAPSTPPPQCNADPWSCPTGKTCVEMDVQGATFGCVNSSSAKAGDPCEGYVATGECGDGLTCLLMVGYPKVCTPYCDNKDHPCPNGATCIAAKTQGGQMLNICKPSTPVTDGGADAELPDGSGTDAGSPDSAEPDAEPQDGGESEAGNPDSSATDAAPSDASDE